MMNKVQTWKDLPINKHTWSFYYYCKRLGYKVSFIKNEKTMDLKITVM